MKNPPLRLWVTPMYRESTSQYNGYTHIQKERYPFKSTLQFERKVREEATSAVALLSQQEFEITSVRILYSKECILLS